MALVFYILHITSSRNHLPNIQSLPLESHWMIQDFFLQTHLAYFNKTTLQWSLGRFYPNLNPNPASYISYQLRPKYKTTGQMNLSDTLQYRYLKYSHERQYRFAKSNVIIIPIWQSVFIIRGHRQQIDEYEIKQLINWYVNDNLFTTLRVCGCFKGSSYNYK